MNPLSWSGPQFLVFYALFAVATLGMVYVVRRRRETRPHPSLELKDPYLFACLSGGPRGVIRVAIAGLIDRGLLKLSDGVAHTAEHARSAFGQVRIERELLDHFRHGASLEAAFDDRQLTVTATADYERHLRSHGLIPDAGEQSVRRSLLFAALVALLGIGGLKLLIALHDGRTNIMFLIVLMVAATITAVKIWNPYQTRVGEDYLASVRSLFSGLRQRATEIRPGSGSRELLWFTALFGFTFLPSVAFPFASHFRSKNNSSCGSAGCGSSSGCGGGGSGCGGCGS